MTDTLPAFLDATMRTATPLALAALGEMVLERAGIINIGLEGVIIAGAFGAALAASAGVAASFAAAVAAGLLVAVLLGVFVVALDADQIVTGTALTLLALGTTGLLYRTVFGPAGVALSIPTVRPFVIPGLSAIPVVGQAVFAQPVTTYVAYTLIPIMTWWFRKTHAGLALRAVGENPAAAIAAGISPNRIRWSAVVFAGSLGGLSGGSLVLAQVGTFAEGMSAGRGFIAIAIVALGRWSPLGVGIASLLFGGATALQYLFQSLGWNVPYQLFLALPYVVTLVALTAISRQHVAPAFLGRRWTTDRF